MLHIQAVQDVPTRDLCSLVTPPLGIPEVQVIINEIYDMQPMAESQMGPVVRSADRHAELGAVPVTPQPTLLCCSLLGSSTLPGLTLSPMRLCL